jgi:hypothetical protein
MLLLLAALSSLTSLTPPSAQTPPADPSVGRRLSVFVLDFKADGTDLDDVAKAASTRVAESLARHARLEVMTREDVVRLVELEAEKQLLSCDTAQGSCLSELAGALGADLLAFGNIARVGESLVASLTVYDARSGSPIGRRSVSATTADALRRALPAAVHDIVTPLVGPAETRAWTSPLFIGGVAALVVGAGGAVGLGGFALTQDAVLGDRTATTIEKQNALGTGVVAAVSASVCAIAAVAGGVSMGLAFATEEQ